MAFIKMLVKRILVLLVFYQLCRLLFLALNYTYFKSLTAHGFVHIIYGSFRFDLSALMYLNAVYILLFILPVSARYNKNYQRFAKIIFLISNGAALITNIIDSAYYRFTFRRTDLSFFSEFEHDTTLLHSIGKFAFSYWYIVLLAILFAWLLIRSYDWIKMPEKQNRQALAWQIVLLFPTVIVWLGLARGSFMPATRPADISNAGDYVGSPTEISLVINTPFAIFSSLQNKGFVPVKYFATDEESAQLYSPVQSYSSDSTRKTKNVVIIIVESLSREFIGRLNGGVKDYQGYTPFLDSLIPSSLSFEYGFANGRSSIEALPSVTAGIPSFEQPYVLTPYVGDNILSIAAVLKKYNYQTSFYHGGRHGSMDFTGFAKVAGFDKTFSMEDYGNAHDYDGTWGIYDEEYLQYWAQQMNTYQQPFCSALFTVTSHHPFKIPEKYNAQFKGGPLPIHHAIQYTDYALRKFFETASKMPWYRNTVFVITADHAAPYSYYPQYQNSIGVFSIPIIFFTPDSTLVGMRNDLIQQTDIFPTLVNYLGLKDTIVSFGKSVLHISQQHLVVNCYGGLYQAFYGDYLLQFDGKKETGFYLFKEDMRLQNNLLGKKPEEENKILPLLKAYIQQYSYRIRENKLTPI